MNAAPQFINNSLTISEGQTVPLTLSNLDASDVDNDVNALQFTITSLVGGSFERVELVNGVEVVTVLAGPGVNSPIAFSRADIANNLIRFVQDDTQVAPSYTVTASDGVGGLTSAPATVAFTPENDVPLFQVNQLTIKEGGTVILNKTLVNGVVETNLLSTDEETASTKLKYTVVSVAEGQFQLLGGASGPQTVTEFTQGQVDAGLIQFAHRADSEIPPTYTLSVSDEAGESASREVTLLNPTTFSVNDAPKITVNALKVNEGQTVTISTANLDATDVDNPRDSLVFTIQPGVDPVTNKSLLAGQFQVRNQSGQFASNLTFTRADILGGRVRFVHNSSNSTPQYTVKVSDGTATTDPSAAQVTFTPINDQPVFATNTLKISENQTVTLSTDNIVTTDEESPPEALTYTINKVAQGSFTLLDSVTKAPTALAVGNTFTQAQVNAGLVQFTHNGSELAPSYTLTVKDGGINNNPATGLSVTREVSIPPGGFTLVNDAPELLVNTLTLEEGDTVVLSGQNLNATDVEDNDAALIYTITAVTGGRFERVTQVNGQEVVEVLASAVNPPAVPLDFTQDQVLLGQIRFVHDPATNAAPTYQVQVRDLNNPPATASGSAQVNFTPVNDAPVLGTLALAIEEGKSVALNATNLSVTDEETGPEGIVYTVNKVAGGNFYTADGKTVLTTFTQAQINEGTAIAFVQDNSNTAPSFSLTVADGPLDAGGQTLTVESGDKVVFTATNDAPVIKASAFNITEGGTVKLTSGLLNTIDEESGPDQLTYTVNLTSADPAKPDYFIIGGTKATDATLSFTQAQVNAGQVQFVQGGSNSAPQLKVSVSDVFTGNPITLPVDLKVNFAAVNDAPLFATNTLKISEGGTVVLNSDPLAPNLVTTDEESPPEALVYTINKVGQGFFELLDPNAAAPVKLDVGATFTQAQVNAGLVQFTQDSSEVPPTYTLTVTDAGINGDLKTALSVTREVTVESFTTKNDPPTLVTNTLTLTEGESIVLTSENLNATDPETNSADLIFTVTSVTGGRFERVTVVDGQEQIEVLAANTDPATTPVDFTQNDVLLGLIRFVNDPAVDTPPTYTVSVRDLNDPAGVANAPATVNFTAVNDVPVLDTLALKITEGETVVLTTANLKVTDEETPADKLVYTVDKVAGGNFYTADGKTVVTTFTQAQIDAGNAIAFVHDSTNNPPSFTLTAVDGPLDAGGQAITFESTDKIAFTPTNDKATVTVNPVALTEGAGPLKLSAAILNAVDEESGPEQLIYTATLANSDPNQLDYFVVNGTKVTDPTVTFTQAQVNAGQVQFVQAGGNAAPQLKITLTDTFTPVEQQITQDVPPILTFKAVNDAPVFATNTLTITEGGSVIFNSKDLNLVTTDEESPVDALTYKVDAVAQGKFERLDLVAGTATEIAVAGTFTQAEVNGGLIRFTHDSSELAPSYTLTVTDTGTPDDPNPKSVTKTVEIPVGGFIKVNDAPTLTVNQLTVTENETVTLTPNNLKVTDPDSALSRIKFQFTDVKGGEFLLNGQPLAVGQSVSQTDLSFGLVAFKDDGLEGPPSYTVVATDPQGGASSAPATINYTPVNDLPRLVTNAFTITEGGLLTLNDPDTGVVNLVAQDDETTNPAELVFTISNVKGGAFSTFLNEPVSTFTQEQLNNGDIVFVQDKSETVPSFDITVADKDGGQITEAAKVTLVPVNDPPVLTANQLKVQEGGSVVLTADNLFATDPDNASTDLSFAIAGLPAGQGEFQVDTDGDGTFDLKGVTTFSLEQVTKGQVRFVDDGDEIAPSYTVVVGDGKLTNGAPQAAKVELVPTNDVPIANDDSGADFTTKQNTKLTAVNVLKNDIDPDAGDVLTITQVDKQAIAAGGAAIKLTSGALVSLNADGTFIYDPNGAFVALPAGKTATDSFVYTLSDKAGTTDTATVTLTIAGVNDAPVLKANTLSITEGGTVVLSTAELLAADPDNGPTELTFTISGLTGGSFSRDTDGDGKFDQADITQFTQQEVIDKRIAFTDNGDEVPPVYSVSVSDGDAALATPPVPVTLGKFINVNDPPIAVNDSGVGFSTDEDTPFTTGSVLANDTDPEGDTLTVTTIGINKVTAGGPAVIIASGAKVSLNSDGTFTYDPNKAFESLDDGKSKTDTFSYTISDGKGGTATATVSVEVVGEVGNDNAVFDFEQYSRYQLLDNNKQVIDVPFVQGNIAFDQLFDEGYYLNQNPDITAAVNAGAFSSGYDHFVRFGWREGRNPSLLYNEAYYLSQNPDVAQAVAGGAFSSGFVHFIQSGQREGRNPSALFNQQDYLLANPDVAAAVTSGALTSAFEHYVEAGNAEGRLPSLFLYNEAYYLQQNPDVAQAVASDVFSSGFEHYVRFGQREIQRNPSELFSEGNYLALNQDVAQAVFSGVFSSGFEHYVSFGRFEGRAVFA